MRFEDDAPMLRWQQVGEPRHNHPMTEALLKRIIPGHQFFIVETLTQKEIIIGHPVSVRLGLIQVLCENHAKTVSSIKMEQTITYVESTT